MPDSVAMDVYVAERDADKLDDWADTGPDEIGHGIVQMSQSEVPWGRTSDIVALNIPFYGGNDSHYGGIAQSVFAYDGETYAEAPTVSYETGDPALTLDADGTLHGMQEAFEYWRVRKRAEEKMRIDPACAAGLHSWVDDPSIREGNCTRCGEPYGDPK